VFCDKSLELRFKGRKHALQLRFVYLEIPRSLLLNLVNLQEHNQTILMMVQQNRNATICSFRSNLNILTSQAKLAEKIDEAASMCDTDFCQQFCLQELQCSAMSINVVRTYMLLTDTAALLSSVGASGESVAQPGWSQRRIILFSTPVVQGIMTQFGYHGGYIRGPWKLELGR
jgi:hypothetical protein